LPFPEEGSVSRRSVKQGDFVSGHFFIALVSGDFIALLSDGVAVKVEGVIAIGSGYIGLG
jgi:hypothetical protein